uniref:Uncharacterized protein n=1 Tax=Tanacetum cinerariifolium TaxID=118510 RepID=A0A699IDP9_TANCI|nr:hypothetical protein [Tanacetum cinerariifolium]
MKKARGDDEVKLIDKESSDSDDEDEVTEILKIDTNAFDFETPMCRAFKELNYLLQIDPDVLTKTIEGFKTYEDYKDDWIYDGNEDVPWVHERPWTDNGIWKEPTPVRHHYEPFNYKMDVQSGQFIAGKMMDIDSKPREEDLKNKAIIEGIIDQDDESSNEGWRRWDNFENTNHDHEER